MPREGIVKATLLAAALAALSSAAVEAAILTVTGNNDSGPGSLRAAVAASAAGDTITFAANVVGKIVLTSGQISISHALTITGPGWRQLQVEGNYNDRIFEILEAAPASCPAPTGPVDYVVTISGLGLGSGARNNDDPGGAINAFHSLHLDSVVIYDNAARSGGGIDILTAVRRAVAVDHEFRAGRQFGEAAVLSDQQRFRRRRPGHRRLLRLRLRALRTSPDLCRRRR